VSSQGGGKNVRRRWENHHIVGQLFDVYNSFLQSSEVTNTNDGWPKLVGKKMNSILNDKYEIFLSSDLG